MPAKKSRTAKPTSQEKALATEAQSPKRSLRSTAKVNVAFNVFKRKMNETRYADAESIEWIPAADLVGVPFMIERTFLWKSSFGKQLGFEITVDDEKRLLSLPLNAERKALHDAIVQWRRENAATPSVGPMAIELIENDNPAYKPYVRLTDWDGEDED